MAQLREYVTDPGAGKVIAGAWKNQTDAMKAFHYYDTLVCSKLDVAALAEFKQHWSKDPRSRSGN